LKLRGHTAYSTAKNEHTFVGGPATRFCAW
jgi:hypothetical protein